MSAPGSYSRLLIVVGGMLDARLRQDVFDGRRARIDVLEMAAAFGGRLYDFGYLQQDAGKDAAVPFAGRRRAAPSSHALAWAVLRQVSDDDVIYATGEDVGFALALGLRAGRRDRPRLIMRLETPFYGRTTLRQTAYDGYRRLALPRIDHIVCRTSAHLHYLHSVERVPLARLSLGRETTDPAFFHPDAVTCDRDTTGTPAIPYIVSAGLEMRDYPTLIEAVNSLPINLIIAAGSPWSRNRIDLTGTGSLPPNVRVSTYSPVQLRQLYAAAQFAVVPVKPTLRACGMNVVLEAWAMGKAVIASRTAGLVDYLEPGRTGLFHAPGDAADLRACIGRLLQRPAMAIALGQAGQKIVAEDLNLDRYIERIGSIVRALSSVPATNR